MKYLIPIVMIIGAVTLAIFGPNTLPNIMITSAFAGSAIVLAGMNR